MCKQPIAGFCPLIEEFLIFLCIINDIFRLILSFYFMLPFTLLSSYLFSFSAFVRLIKFSLPVFPFKFTLMIWKVFFNSPSSVGYS